MVEKNIHVNRVRGLGFANTISKNQVVNYVAGQPYVRLLCAKPEHQLHVIKDTVYLVLFMFTRICPIAEIIKPKKQKQYFE
jgi:hypothetical protein